MKLKLAGLCTVVCVVTVAACSKDASTPASPTPSAAVSTEANADGSTLKVSAPATASPANGQRLELADGITLTVANGAAKFSGPMPLTYRFQIYNAANVLLQNVGGIPQGNGSTSWPVPVTLDGDQTYTWRARAELGNDFGPWSNTASFVVPVSEGYIRAREIYDPLTNGKTVGRLVGDVTLIPGKGLRINSQLGYVRYELPQTLLEGEFSILTSDMDANTDGDKTKLFAMGQGDDDIVTNDRRMTVEKRGDPAGVVAWRFITHDDQVDTEGPDRQFIPFVRTQTYLWQATWRNNRFNLLIREGGADGRVLYNLGKNFAGRPYDPAPHVLYLGAPVGRSGEAGASVDNVTIRQMWVSGSPRPAFANK